MHKLFIMLATKRFGLVLRRTFLPIDSAVPSSARIQANADNMKLGGRTVAKKKKAAKKAAKKPAKKKKK